MKKGSGYDCILHSGVLQLCLLFAIGHQQTKTLHGGPWVTLFFNSFLHEMWVDNLYCRDTHDLLKTCWKIKDIHKIGLALCISLSGTACIWRHAFDGIQIQLQLQIWIFSFYYDIHGMEYKPASDYPALLYKVQKSLLFNKHVLTHVIHHTCPHVYDNCTRTCKVYTH